MPAWNPLLAPPAYPADRFAPLADRLRALLGTRSDLVFVQAEAIVALEATAASLARPGLRAINVVTSPYGRLFGDWLARGGAVVSEVAADPGQPVEVAAVARAIEATPGLGLLSMVHAETSSGILNPLREIAALAKARGALVAVDAVASFGGHALAVDAWDIDICVVGPQKAIQGPAGLSAVSVSAGAWAAMGEGAPSALSLPDLRSGWLATGRGALPGMPSALEFWALEAALDELDAEGLAARIARHRRAAAASREGLIAMGVAPWVADAARASALATAAPVPDGLEASAVIAGAGRLGVTLSPGFGAIAHRLVRLDHTGARAAFAPVLANVAAYGSALRDLGQEVDLGAAAEAVTEAYRAR